MKGLKMMIEMVWEDNAYSGVVILEGTEYRFQLTMQTVANGLKEISLVSMRQLGEENQAMISESSSLLIPAIWRWKIVYDLLYVMATGNVLAIKKAEQQILVFAKQNEEDEELAT